MRAELSQLARLRADEMRRLELVERRFDSEDAVASEIARAASERFRKEAQRERVLIALAGIVLTALNVAVGIIWGG